MTETMTTALGPIRMLGQNATPIWGMTNAERNRVQLVNLPNCKL